ncbi:MAG TPA: transglycosylase family protein [Acidimicrobiales bacterium]|nr:transglycosylase family protein [Acidimicrobiales bacterium]
MAAVLVLAAVPVLRSLQAANAETMVHPGPPSVEGAEAALDEATTAKAEATSRRSRLQGELAATRQEINALSLEQVALVEELQTARHRVRAVTIRAYTAGAGARDLDLLMDASDIGEHLFRSELLAGNAVDTSEAIEEYEDLRDRADRTVLRLAERVEQIQTGIEDAGTDIEVTTRQIERAQVELSAARAAVSYNASGHPDPGEAAWEQLRFCESGGVYTTNTGNGFYGAYQFDLQTWQSMGGRGLPSAAPYWEQDLRAKALFWARGAQPWPICGRFLG